MRIAEVQDLARRLLDEVERSIIGKRAALELILIAMLADGHALIEDVPGVAKTMIARSLAQVVGLRFGRLQFTPDLLPSDVTGASMLDRTSGELRFQPGPVFCHLLLADEINRAPAKTQSALLEAMQERQVTVEGHTHPLDQPFVVIATENPLESEGTYPLPEAQLDRFLIRTSIGYPGREDEIAVVQGRAHRQSDIVELRQILTREQLCDMQLALGQVHVADPVAAYVVDLVTATRESSRVRVGASPRGSLALLKLSRARAAVRGREHVIPDDVKAIAVPALAHRLSLRPELWVQRFRAEDAVAEVLESVAAPVGTVLETRPG
ncbi:MAG: AAA family ATPase [Candidatus Dormibacteraceae bacterium]